MTGPRRGFASLLALAGFDLLNHLRQERVERHRDTALRAGATHGQQESVELGFSFANGDIAPHTAVFVGTAEAVIKNGLESAVRGRLISVPREGVRIEGVEWLQLCLVSLRNPDDLAGQLGQHELVCLRTEDVIRLSVDYCIGPQEIALRELAPEGPSDIVGGDGVWLKCLQFFVKFLQSRCDFTSEFTHDDFAAGTEQNIVRSMVACAEIDEGADRPVFANYLCDQVFVEAVLGQNDVAVIGQMWF